MSTLTVTTVQTANSTTDLILKTGNTSHPGMVMSAAGATQIGNTTFGATALTGYSFNGTGLYGWSNQSSGVTGVSTSSTGVYGTSGISIGVLGQSTSSTGVSGQSFGAANGVIAQSNTGTGLYVQSNTGTIAQFSNATTSIAKIEANGQFTLGTASATANGYTRLPNGILMQWGSQTASVNATVTATITFPVAFTTFYSLSIDGIGATAAGNNSILNAAPNTTAAVWRSLSTAAASSITVYYVAIGS